MDYSCVRGRLTSVRGTEGMTDLNAPNPVVETALMTVSELSAFLKISKLGIYRMVHCQEVPFIRIGRRLRFSKSEIDQWLQKSRVETLSVQNATKKLMYSVSET